MLRRLRHRDVLLTMIGANGATGIHVRTGATVQVHPTGRRGGGIVFSFVCAPPQEEERECAENECTPYAADYTPDDRTDLRSARAGTRAAGVVAIVVAAGRVPVPVTAARRVWRG